MPSADFQLKDEGEFAMLIPVTDAARAWVAAHRDVLEVEERPGGGEFVACNPDMDEEIAVQVAPLTVETS